MGRSIPSVTANACGKLRWRVKHGGRPQAELVGVGLTNQLGWGEKGQPLRTNYLMAYLNLVLNSEDLARRKPIIDCILFKFLQNINRQFVIC